jgi:hypothetical protein
MFQAASPCCFVMYNNNLRTWKYYINSSPSLGRWEIKNVQLIFNGVSSINEVSQASILVAEMNTH